MQILNLLMDFVQEFKKQEFTKQVENLLIDFLAHSAKLNVAIA